MDHPQQDGGLIGRSTLVIIIVAAIKHRHVEVFDDQQAEGVFERTGQYLAVKSDGNELALVRLIVVVSCHRRSTGVGRLLYANETTASHEK